MNGKEADIEGSAMLGDTLSWSTPIGAARSSC